MSDCSHPHDSQMATSEGLFCMGCGRLVAPNKSRAQKPTEDKTPPPARVPDIKKSGTTPVGTKPVKRSGSIQNHGGSRIQIADIQPKPDDQAVI